MQERRKHRRLNASDPLPVRDSRTRKTVGFLQDISICGLMVSGQGPFKVDVNYKLTLALPKSFVGVRSLELDAVCRWVAKSRTKKALEAGFEFAPLPAKLEFVVRLLQAEYAVSAIEVEF